MGRTKACTLRYNKADSFEKEHSMTSSKDAGSYDRYARKADAERNSHSFCSNATSVIDDARRSLKEVFGYDAFRGRQLDAIESAIEGLRLCRAHAHRRWQG